MLNRLLFAHQKRFLLFIAVFGAFVGFLLLLGALQLYFDFRSVLNGSTDMSKPQFLVINKEVNLLNSLFGGQKGFSAEELRALKEVKGVRDVAGLTSSRFKVSVSMGADGMQGMPGMYTELFFEAVPDEFIDVAPGNWQWKEGDSLVPIVVPRDYIKLYNFGFAPTQGLPQVTENLVGLARFNITIKGSQGNAVFRGKLAGFSERINTILAPKSFIDYANKKFAGVEPGSSAPSRVIVECEGPATTELVDYFSQNGYETSAEALRIAKQLYFVRVVMSFLGGIGGVILLLALLSFFLYSQLLLSRSSYELETLIRIGYSYRKLAGIYVKYYSIVYAVIFAVCIIALWLGKMWVTGYLAEKGFDLPTGLDLTVIAYGAGFAALFMLVNAFSVHRGLRKMC